MKFHLYFFYTNLFNIAVNSDNAEIVSLFLTKISKDEVNFVTISIEIFIIFLFS